MQIYSVLKLNGAIGAVLAGAAGASAALGMWYKFRRRVTPDERERRRRLHVQANGRVCDGEVIDAADFLVHYRYSLAGVDYVTSQDVSAFLEQLPPDLSVLIGPTGVKYLATNPADSIVVGEKWSGLRFRSPAAR